MSVKELKEELQLSGTDTLNVFFASNSVREQLAGAATWPWAKEALTHQGQPTYCLPTLPPTPFFFSPLLPFLSINLLFSVFASHCLLSALVVSKWDGQSNWVWQRFSQHSALFLFQSLFLLFNGENLSTRQQPNKQMVVWAPHHPCLLGSCCLFMWVMHFFLVPVQSSKWTQM